MFYCRAALRNLFFILSITWILSGCEKANDVQKFAGLAQGTSYHISYWSEPPVDAQTLKQVVDAEFTRLDALLSNYRPDSVIEQLNATVSDAPQPVHEEIVSLIKTARTISEASQGCYDLTIKPLFDLWGFKDGKLSIPEPAALQTTLAEVGFKQVEVIDAVQLRKRNPKLRIDLSSIAQGYSVSRIAGILEQHGIDNYLVEIGGELQTRGAKPDNGPWRVALEKPLPGERTMHKIIVIDRKEPLAVMTSGTYRHYFDVAGKRYSHILDATTGRPVEHTTVSVSVLHDDPTQADAWSTALLCLGKNRGLEIANRYGVAALFIEQQGESFNEFRSQTLAKLSGVNIKQ